MVIIMGDLIKNKLIEDSNIFDWDVDQLLGGHTNYIFRAKSNQAHLDVVVRVNKNGDMQKIEKEIKWHEYLFKKNINCPKTINFNTNNLSIIKDLSQNIEYPYFYMEYIEGHHPKIISDYDKAGILLGTFHKLVSYNKIPHVKQRSGFNFNHIQLALKNNTIKEYCLKIGLDLNAIEKLVKFEKKFKIGLCHGDYYDVNCLISKDQAYLIDLENLGVDYLLYDLAMGCYGMFTPRNTNINLSNLKRFLQSYININPNIKPDIIYLKISIICAAIKNSNWRYIYYRNHPNNTSIGPEMWKNSLHSALKWQELNFKDLFDWSKCYAY